CPPGVGSAARRDSTPPQPARGNALTVLLIGRRRGADRRIRTRAPDSGAFGGVLDRAAVGRGVLLRRGLTVDDRRQRGGDEVVGRLRTAARIIIDAAREAEHAVLVDHVHVRRGLRAVGPAHLPRSILQHGVLEALLL